MPALPDSRLWPLLANNHDRRQTLAEWSRVLGSPFLDSVPLALVKGELAVFIRCPDTGIPLEIFETHDGSFCALPPAETELDSRIDGLTKEELRLYGIDWPELLQTIRDDLRLDGTLRNLSFNPPLWHLCAGASRPHYFAILGLIEDVGKAVSFLKPESGGRLLLPAAPDAVFAELSRQGVAFCVLDDVLPRSGGGHAPLADRLNASLEARAETQELQRPEKPDLTNLELKIHLDHRLDTIGHEFVSLKAENTDLKKDLAQSLSNIAARVEPEYFQWIFTIMGAGSMRRAAKLLGIPSSSFDAKLKQYAAKGGIYATLFAMIKTRRDASAKSVESFSEEFTEHQPNHFSDPDHISDLLDGLENLDADNWPGVRDELIELVREELL